MHTTELFHNAMKIKIIASKLPPTIVEKIHLKKSFFPSYLSFKNTITLALTNEPTIFNVKNKSKKRNN